MIAVRDRQDELGDALVVVVTFTGDASRLAGYREHLSIEFPVLTDPERELYALFGVDRGSVRQVWSPGTIAMYGRLLRRGRRLRRPSEDTRQLGADAVIDRTGRLHRLWRQTSPDQRPHVDEFVEALGLIDRS